MRGQEIFFGTTDGKGTTVKADSVATGGNLNITSNVTYDEVFGGYSDTGKTEGNNVTIDGTTVTGDIYGGVADSGDSINNTVSINNSTVNGTICCGVAGYKDCNSYGNEVYINSSTVTGDVFGGVFDAISGEIHDNTVHIANRSTIYGMVSGGHPQKFSNSNTLEIRGKDNKAGAIANFDKFNFVIDKSISYGDTMLTITGVKDDDGSIDDPTTTHITNNVNITVDNPERLKAAEATATDKSITLINNDAGITGFTDSKDVSVKEGALLSYDAKITLEDGKNLKLKIDNFKEAKPKFTPEAKSLV